MAFDRGAQEQITWAMGLFCHFRSAVRTFSPFCPVYPIGITFSWCGFSS